MLQRSPTYDQINDRKKVFLIFMIFFMQFFDNLKYFNV